MNIYLQAEPASRIQTNDYFHPGSRGVVIIIIFVLPFQRGARVTGRVLRHHVGGNEDVLGADERGVDEDVLDRAWSARGRCVYG